MVLLAPVVMGAAKFNYGMEIRDEDHVRSTFVYGVSRADLEEAGKKPSDFSDCDKTFDVSASEKQHGVKAEFVEDKEYVGCKFTMTTTADDARGAGLGLTFDADKVSLSIGRKFFEDARLDKIKVGAFKVSVTFPGKVISHSGSSSVDGNTVTWTDIKDSTSGLKAVGERPTGAATAGPSFWKGFGRHGIRGGIIGLIAGIASYFGNKRRAKKKRAKSGGATATAQYPGYGQPQPQEWQAPGQDGHQYGESMNSGGNQPYMQDGRYIGDPWNANSTNTSGFNEKPNPR